MPKGKRRKTNGHSGRGGFSFFFTKAQIREWLQIPLEHRLMWLEEANRFNSKVIRGRALKVFEAFRAGTM